MNRPFNLLFVVGIFISLLLALGLNCWQMRFTYSDALPNWLVMLLLGWVLLYPQWINLGVAFVLGLLLDSLQGNLLGQHGFALIVIVYLVIKLHGRLQVNPFFQQSLMVMMMLIIYQALLFWPAGVLGNLPHWWYWLSPLWALFIWPPLRIFMIRLHTKYLTVM